MNYLKPSPVGEGGPLAVDSGPPRPRAVHFRRWRKPRTPFVGETRSGAEGDLGEVGSRGLDYYGPRGVILSGENNPVDCFRSRTRP